MQRREFITWTLQTGVVTFLMAPLACRSAPTVKANAFSKDSPLRILPGGFDSLEFTGDNPGPAHKRFWDLEGYIKEKGGRPAVSEKQDIVIVGGGIAGLSAAFHLRHLNPVILELADQFGGNSKGEVFQGLPYTMAASYIGRPDEDTSLYKMLKKIGVVEHARSDRDDADLGFRRGVGFGMATGADWDTRTASLAKRFDEDLRKIVKTGLPTIPWQAGGMSRLEVEALDRLTFADWLKKNYGTDLTAPMMEYFELYCWGAYGGGTAEVSAAQALNFLASETYENWAFPGGNAFVAQKLYEHLSQHLSPSSLRSSQAVLEVKVQQDKVLILVDNANGLQTIECKQCLMAAPKRIARKIIPQMSVAQKAAADFMKWRAYVVANVLVEAPVPVTNFGYYSLKGEIPKASKDSQRAFVDLTVANWASGHKSDPSVLTLYRPLPFDQGSATLLAKTDSSDMRSEMIASAGEILVGLGIPADRIRGARFSRFGHALPLAKPEFIARKFDLAFKEATLGRIHYANQDNDLSPSFECAYENAERAAREILKLFGSGAAMV